MDISKIIQEIQYILAPAIMVSSSALLLLGFQTKFSNLANRFRVLNHEKRALSQKAQKETSEEDRLGNLTSQIHHLMRRASHVKNAIVLTYGAIICFAGTSILIFLNIYTSFKLVHSTVAIFLVGLVMVFLSAILMILETMLFYQVISLEKES